MMDEIFDRTYQRGRADLNGGIERAIGKAARGFAESFAALHRLQWSAPWNTSGPKTASSRDAKCA